MCERKCTDSESSWSTGVRGKEGGVAVGRGGAGPLRDVVEPIYIFHLINHGKKYGKYYIFHVYNFVYNIRST